MDYKDLDSITLKMNLLSGDVIKVGNLDVKPYTLDEIKKYGYEKYMNNIQWISISLDDFLESIAKESKKEIVEKYQESLKTFDFFTKIGGEDSAQRTLGALKMIFRTEDIEVLHNGIVVLDFYKNKILYKKDGKIQTNEEVLDYYYQSDLRIIDRENFDEIVEVVKLQNYIMKTTKIKEESNPADEETRKLMEAMRKNQEKVEKMKKNQRVSDEKEEIDISDIISAVSTKSNTVNKFNIWQMTLYQLYDEYSRLELIDSYEFSLKAIVAGAQKVNINHWSSKL